MVPTELVRASTHWQVERLAKFWISLLCLGPGFTDVFGKRDPAWGGCGPEGQGCEGQLCVCHCGGQERLPAQVWIPADSGAGVWGPSSVGPAPPQRGWGWGSPFPVRGSYESRFFLSLGSPVPDGFFVS